MIPDSSSVVVSWVGKNPQLDGFFCYEKMIAVGMELPWLKCLYSHYVIFVYETVFILLFCIVFPQELCQFSVNAISGYAWHICVKYRLLLIEWESVCEMPIGQSCDWHTSPKRGLDDVGATAGHMGSGCCAMGTTGHRTPSIKVH